MITVTKTASRRRTPFVLALNCVLLVLIAYGATAGLVHRHDVGGGIAQANFSTIDAAASGAEDSDSSTRPQFHGNACLICQLHRQLSQGLAHASPFAESPPTQRLRATFAPSSYFSVLSTSQRGRAPPAHSLS